MKNVIQWLLEGDVSIRYLTHKYLLRSGQAILDGLQKSIALEGYGARFLSCQTGSGHWGLYYYQPKWTSTHYTLLDLKNIGAQPALKPCRDMVERMLDQCMTADGGLNLSKNEHPSDICVDGMALSYAAWFCPEEPRLERLVSFLLSSQKADGGFAWDLSSKEGDPHTTICVLEGLSQYSACPRRREFPGMEAVIAEAFGYLSARGLFMEDRDKRFLKLSYPHRYRYDLLRALECLTDLKVPVQVDPKPALSWLLSKRGEDGRWPLELIHPGKTHFSMEEPGQPSRFITLKALRVLERFQKEANQSMEDRP